jgi:hypothetical protein
MAAGSAKCVWRIPSGIRVAQGAFNEILSVDLKAWPHVDEGDLVSVTFHVAVNGGAATDHVVLAESVRVPNFTDQDSPLPGVTSGVAWKWCHGFDLDLTTLDGGTVVITATVRSNTGGTDYDTTDIIRMDTALPGSVTIFNDTDGVDRRPCTGVIYLSNTGNDANNGLTSGAPKLTHAGAIDALVALSTSSPNIRGGKIILMSGAHNPRGGTSPGNWHTGTEGYVDFEFAAGASIARVKDATGGDVYPDSLLTMPGNGAGTFCRVHLIAPRNLSAGYSLNIAANVTGMLWFDGGSTASIWDNGSNHLAKFIDDTGEMAGVSFGAGTGRLFATCHSCTGVNQGFVGCASVMDGVVERWVGIACYDTGGVAEMNMVDVHITDFDYIHEDLPSDVQGVIDYAGGANMELEPQVGGAHAGMMRLTFVGATPYDIGANAAAGLVGSMKAGLNLAGFDLHNGTYEVLEAGTGYIILNNPIEEPATGGAEARIVTAQVSNGLLWNDWVHPNAWRTQGNRNPSVERLVVDHTVSNTRAMAPSGSTMVGAVFDDIALPVDCRVDFDGGVFTDCIFRHITTEDALDFGGGTTCTNSVFHDIVCNSASTNPITAGAKSVTRFHRVSQAAIGTNGTTGAWFNAAGNYTPAVGVRGLDSGLYTRHASAKWSTDVAWSQGCSSYLGLADWTEPVEGGGSGPVTGVAKAAPVLAVGLPRLGL